MPAKRIHFYANVHDQIVIARIRQRRPHWTVALVIREALYLLDKQQREEEAGKAKSLGN